MKKASKTTKAQAERREYFGWINGYDVERIYASSLRDAADVLEDMLADSRGTFWDNGSEWDETPDTGKIKLEVIDAKGEDLGKLVVYVRTDSI